MLSITPGDLVICFIIHRIFRSVLYFSALGELLKESRVGGSREGEGNRLLECFVLYRVGTLGYTKKDRCYDGALA